MIRPTEEELKLKEDIYKLKVLINGYIKDIDNILFKERFIIDNPYYPNVHKERIVRRNEKINKLSEKTKENLSKIRRLNLKNQIFKKISDRQIIRISRNKKAKIQLALAMNEKLQAMKLIDEYETKLKKLNELKLERGVEQDESDLHLDKIEKLVKTSKEDIDYRIGRFTDYKEEVNKIEKKLISVKKAIEKPKIKFIEKNKGIFLEKVKLEKSLKEAKEKLKINKNKLIEAIKSDYNWVKLRNNSQIATEEFVKKLKNKSIDVIIKDNDEIDVIIKDEQVEKMKIIELKIEKEKLLKELDILLRKVYNEVETVKEIKTKEITSHDFQHTINTIYDVKMQEKNLGKSTLPEIAWLIQLWMR